MWSVTDLFLDMAAAYDTSESFLRKSLVQETFARKLAQVLHDTLAS